MNLTSQSPVEWLRRGYLLLFALLPWSVEIPLGWRGTSIRWPVEPLLCLLGVGVLYLVFWVEKGVFFKKNKHLALGLVGAWLAWQGVCAATSTLPIVSAKYLAVEYLHVLVFLVGMGRWPEWWPACSRVFAVSLLGVVVWTLTRHGLWFGWRADQANLAPMPFFADHTVYAATLSMVGVGLLGTQNRLDRWLAAVLLLAVAVSTCRAAVGALLLVALFYVFSAWVQQRFDLIFFQKKDQAATRKTIELSKHPTIHILLIFKKLFKKRSPLARSFFYKKNLRSVALAAWCSIGCSAFFGAEKMLPTLRVGTTDVSALERLNRYDCALRMAADRPLLGFGPGTFQFAYLPYQRPEWMTRISVTTPIAERRHPTNFGHGGGTHSEYLQALAESGWLGLLGWLGLSGWVLGRAWRSPSGVERWWLLGLLTFLIHGVANNFLHDARIAAWFWSILGMLFFKKINPTSTLLTLQSP
jgi:putative inorganic carbon (hco3(-)) transporter